MVGEQLISYVDELQIELVLLEFGSLYPFAQSQRQLVHQTHLPIGVRDHLDLGTLFDKLGL